MFTVAKFRLSYSTRNFLVNLRDCQILKNALVRGIYSVDINSSLPMNASRLRLYVLLIGIAWNLQWRKVVVLKEGSEVLKIHFS